MKRLIIGMKEIFEEWFLPFGHYPLEAKKLLYSQHFRGPGSKCQDDQTHLREAMDWLRRAQENSGDDGVSHGYCMAYNANFKKRGWLPSYPETTGYIIPTFLEFYKTTGDEDFFQRALRMADWECKVQMENGAVQGGTVDQPPTPSIFNTGMGLFGWLAAYREAGENRYMQSAIQAGNFLVAAQDPDGAWRRGESQYVLSGIHTYNVRVAWALLLLYNLTQEISFNEAALKNIEFSSKRQRDNGWFEDNCLSNNTQPLLHTIAYAMRGILECGIILNSEQLIQKVRIPAKVLIHLQKADGSLAGRFDDSWRPAVNWSCLTGNAQLAIILLKLYLLDRDPSYLDAARRLINFNKSVQLLDGANGIRGGIAGSFPINGGYGRYEILNWATKFFADALIFLIALEKRGEDQNLLQRFQG